MSNSTTVSSPIKRKRGRPRKVAVRQPAQMGRPRAITPELYPLIEKLSGKGWTNLQISSALNVTSATYRNTRNGDLLSEEDKEALSCAIERGRLAYWESLDVIGEKHMNAPGGVAAWIFAKKQQAGGGWKDQQSIDHTGGITITVQRQRIGDDGQVIDITPEIE